MTLEDWDKAAGVTCRRCGRETLRIRDGLCQQCYLASDDANELIKACLAGKDLTKSEYRTIWTAFNDFSKKLLTLKKKQRLQFNRKLKLRRWIVWRVSAGCRCVMAPERECPCSEPLLQGCPLFRPGK